MNAGTVGEPWASWIPFFFCQGKKNGRVTRSNRATRVKRKKWTKEGTSELTNDNRTVSLATAAVPTAALLSYSISPSEARASPTWSDDFDTDFSLSLSLSLYSPSIARATLYAPFFNLSTGRFQSSRREKGPQLPLNLWQGRARINAREREIEGK